MQTSAYIQCLKFGPLLLRAAAGGARWWVTGVVTIPVRLDPEQKKFLAHACAFIDTNPSQGDLDKLLTLAAMLLPAPVATMLAKRASGNNAGLYGADAMQLTRWLQ